MGNPYRAEAIQRAYDHGDTPVEEAALVRGEYEYDTGPVSCLCGGEAYYKASVGCCVCTTCGSLYRRGGALIKDRRAA